MSQNSEVTENNIQAQRKAQTRGPDDQVSPVSIGALNAEEGAAGNERLPRSLLDPINLTLSVELGRAELTFRELQGLAQGAVVELDHMVGDPLEVRVNGYLIARGEVVAIKNEQHYGIRVTEVVRHESAGAGEA